MQSPLGLVPKAGNKTRLIFHLSYDFGQEIHERSLNFHTPKDLCTVKYRDLDYAVQCCLKLNLVLNDDGLLHSTSIVDDQEVKDDSACDGIFMAKTDLMSAFRILPVLVSQRRFLAMKANHPLTNKTWFFIEKNLPFGASSACANFQAFSDSLQHILESIEGTKYRCVNYLDDYMFLSESEELCNRMMRAFLDLCSFIGCPVASEKTEWATQELVFLGILLNGRYLTLSVPEEKRVKALNLLSWVINRKSITIKTIQRLTGILNFLSRAIVPGRAFTRMMYKKLCLLDNSGDPLKQYHHVKVDNNFKQDCLIWKSFLVDAPAIHLCRPFVDLSEKLYARTLNFYTDASLNSRYGIGGIFENKYFVGRWPAGFIEDENPSIEFAELLALAAGILTWGRDSRLMNTRVVIFCDNESVMKMVNKLTSSCPKCMKLIRLLIADGLKYNRHIFVKYVKSEFNVLADALSRMQCKHFHKFAPLTTNIKASTITEKLWPVGNIWFDN